MSKMTGQEEFEEEEYMMSFEHPCRNCNEDFCFGLSCEINWEKEPPK